MISSTLRTGLCLAAALAFVALGGERAAAQCATCPQPTIAYSPVVAPVVAPQPVVLQTAAPATGWYPGKYLGRIFRPFRSQPAAVQPAPTFVTAAYQPTFSPASYATFSTMQTVARPVALASCQTCACNPCCCNQTTAFRPVTLTALSPCCDPCSGCALGGCASCASGSGVTTAGFNQPVGGCANCAGGQAAPVSPQPAPLSGGSGVGGLEPTPALPLDSAAPEQRVNRPEINRGGDPAIDGSGSRDAGAGDPTSWWDPPQLFDGGDRSAARRPTRGPTTNVWNAVYRQQAAPQARRTAYRPADTTPAPRRNVQVGASGWRSAE